MRILRRRITAGAILPPTLLSSSLLSLFPLPPSSQSSLLLLSPLPYLLTSSWPNEILGIEGFRRIAFNSLGIIPPDSESWVSTMLSSFAIPMALTAPTDQKNSFSCPEKKRKKKPYQYFLMLQLQQPNGEIINILKKYSTTARVTTTRSKTCPVWLENDIRARTSASLIPRSRRKEKNPD